MGIEIIKPIKFVAKAVVLLPLLLLVFIWANGQDKDLEAQMHYTTAEDKYTKGGIQNFEDCFEELGKTEIILGITNPRILYLKVKALSEIAKLSEPYYFYDTYYYYDIDTCLKTFFKITDAKSYPVEKYTEILNIRDLFQKRGQFFGAGYFDNFKTLHYKKSDTALIGHAQFLWAYTKEKFLINRSQASYEGKPSLFVSNYNYRKYGFSDSALMYPELQKARQILLELSNKENTEAMYFLVQLDEMLDYKDWEGDPLAQYSTRLVGDEKFLQKLAETGDISSMRLLSKVYQSYANNILSSKKERKEAMRISRDWEKKADEAYKVKYGHK